MNPTKLSFESENLSIHYICFNIRGFIELEYIKKIAFYLFESFGFNLTFISYETFLQLNLLLFIIKVHFH